MLKELHSIKPFRGGDLGIIRLDNLAYPDKKRIKIIIGNEEVKPIGFDTYGHPIISKENFAYYKALKAIAERKGESLVPSIEYEKKPFCIKKEVYDSLEGIKKSLNKLEEFKKLLIMRKQAAFCGIGLDTFVIFCKYVLAPDGHIYAVHRIETEDGMFNKIIMHKDEIKKLLWEKEVHIPSEEDVCAICGKSFLIKDVIDFGISENEECRKVHRKCMDDSIKAINYAKASKIIDAVYVDEGASSEIGEIFDSEENEIKTCYTYKTKQGTISIYFRNKVTVIKWHDNFKPFNMSLFDNERVTKFDRGIHAWSIDDAIKYLQMAKKA